MTSTTIDRAAWRAHGAGWGLAAALLAPAAWAAPFTINADGTATDAATSLVWDRCYLGQSAAVYCAATVTPERYTWQAALQKVAELNAQADGYKGYTDWRLPNKNELESLVKLDATAAPFIDTPAFVGTQTSGNTSVFWSSTTYAPDPAGAWVVGFYGGLTGAYGKSNSSAVRLVRSGQSFAFFDALDTTPPAITAGPTLTPGANGTTASASVTVGEAATGYWQVLPAADPAPSAATLLALGTAQQVALAAGVAASISLTSLTPGTAYTLYFIAKDAASNAQASVASASFTTANVPGTPTATTATPGSAQATVSWMAPAYVGGGITQYTVTAPGTAGCTAAPPATSCTVTGLANGQTYTFSVRAENAVGQSAATQANAVTPLTSGTAFSAQSPTSTGLVSVAVTSGGGATCTFERVQLLPVASASPTPPAHVQFPHGLLDFVLNGCDATPVTLTITYPQALPQGGQYWKLRNGTWAAYGQAVVVAGATTAELTLQDGGVGDDDGVATANGRIVDPGGMALLAAPAGAAAIPTLGPWALALLAGVLGCFGVGRLRRRGA